jgi:hypothetical protein
MPWFIAPVERWFRGMGQGRCGKMAIDGRRGMCHAGLGTPDDWLVRYFGEHVRSDRRHGGRPWASVCFDPEATYRGALFGTALVTLMLTADARAHEVLQISADRFVRPVRIYVVKNTDGTPKRDPTTNQVVTDVIVQQRLLPKCRKRDDQRLQYDVSAARTHVQEKRVGKTADGGRTLVDHLGRTRWQGNFGWLDRAERDHRVPLCSRHASQPGDAHSFIQPGAPQIAEFGSGDGVRDRDGTVIAATRE